MWNKSLELLPVDEIGIRLGVERLTEATGLGRNVSLAEAVLPLSAPPANSRCDVAKTCPGNISLFSRFCDVCSSLVSQKAFLPPMIRIRRTEARNLEAESGGRA